MQPNSHLFRFLSASLALVLPAIVMAKTPQPSSGEHHHEAAPADGPSIPTPGGGHEGTPGPLAPPPDDPGDDQPAVEGMTAGNELTHRASDHNVAAAHTVSTTPDAPEDHDAENAHDEPSVKKAESWAERLAMAESLLRIAERKHENHQDEDARLSLKALLELHPGEELEIQGLRLLAESYRSSEDLPRAAAILERLIADYPADPCTPENLLALGRIYREMGVTKLALARFYSVLNSTLKLSEDNLEHYQLVARTAQFEIAETHLATGHYEEASEYFRRLSLLDLAPEDRARAQFKAASSLFLAEDWKAAGTALQRFLQNTPNNDDFPEAYFLLSFCYQRTDRHEESLRVALKLFDKNLEAQTTSPMNWRYWQRRIGNQLANEFFSKGQLTYALKLYDQLASITPEPEWRAPALYQVAVTAERLGLYPRADEAYSEVEALAKQFPQLAEIGEMATWRRENLAWTLEFERNRLAVLGINAPRPESSIAASEDREDDDSVASPES